MLIIPLIGVDQWQPSISHKPIHPMKLKQLLLTTTLCTASLFASEAAFAHSIETDFQARFDSFKLKTTFGTGEAFPDAPVTVYSPENPDEPILVGRTDANGEFTFKADPSKPGNWKVEIGNADDNHWDQLIVPVSARGIQINDVSELPPQPEHQHDYFAYSFLLMIVALGFIFGTRKLNNHLDI